MAQLSQEQIRDFKATLRQRAGVLREEIQAALVRSQQEPYVRIAEQARDMEDDSFADLMVDVNLSDIDRDVQELRDIDGAMHRLLDGTYGQCEDCGADISLRRLQAQPTATRCVQCQERYEKTHAHAQHPSL